MVNTRTLEIVSPHTGQKLRSIQATTEEELERVIQRSKTVQRRWRETSFSERSEVLLAISETLRSRADLYAKEIQKLNGKTEQEALIAEIFPTLAHFNYFAKNAKKYLEPESLFLSAVPFAKSKLIHEPLGVIGVISPWNYPFFLSLIHVSAALMAGNTVVIKPSEYSAGIGKLIERLLQESPIDPVWKEGLIQLVYGYGDLGNKLISSGVSKVCFTGSTKTGHVVYESASRLMLPVTLEMGGKDPAIVLEDADLSTAIPGIVWGGFVNCGQACASIEKLYVPFSRKEEFEQRISDYVSSLGAENFGTMNTLNQKAIVESQLREALEKGAKVIAETKELDPENPYRLQGKVLVDVPKDSRLFLDETFGPLLPIYYYKNVEEVISELNSSQYGLTCSLWTTQLKKAEELAERIDVGVVTINDHLITPGFPEAPWLGHKESGLGFSASYHSLYGLSKMKYVYHDRGQLKYKFWQYPYTRSKASWIKLIIESQFNLSRAKKVMYTAVSMPRLFLKDRD